MRVVIRSPNKRKGRKFARTNQPERFRSCNLLTFDVDDSEPSFVKVVVDIVDWPSTTPFGSAAYDNFIESDEENNEVTVPGPV